MPLGRRGFGRPEPPRGGGWHRRPPEPPPPPRRSLFGPGRPPRHYGGCLGCCMYVLGAAALLTLVISLLAGLL